MTSPDPHLLVPRIAAIIPVGTLEGAKTRLAGTLDAEERHDLVTGLLRRTVVAALAVDRLADVVVVSPDPEVLHLAADLGARTLRQRSAGLNAGLLEARDDVIDFAFGPGSRAAHRDRAAAARARFVEVDGPLAIDLDTPEDLVLIESTAPEGLGVG